MLDIMNKGYDEEKAANKTREGWTYKEWRDLRELREDREVKQMQARSERDVL